MQSSKVVLGCAAHRNAFLCYLRLNFGPHTAKGFNRLPTWQVQLPLTKHFRFWIPGRLAC